jgi:hypothetical protein
MNREMTTIIAADYMYLIILSDDSTIDKVLNILNSNDDIIDDKNNDNDKNKKHQKNRKNKKNRSIYIKHDIHVPCSELIYSDGLKNMLIDEAKEYAIKNNLIPIESIDSDDEIDLYKKYIVFDEGIESAHCLTYADITSSNNLDKINNRTTMIMELQPVGAFYKLTFPILQLDEEENSDKLVGKWMKENNLCEIIKETSIKPINIVKSQHDILVFTAYVK